MSAVVLAHAAATVFLAGVIWLVQVLHYPLFALVGGSTFADYEASHSRRITQVIVAPWAVQGVTVAWMLALPPPGVDRWLIWLSAVAAATTVVVTVALSVPQHRVLSDGFDAAAHRTLVVTNWIRTTAWSVGGAAGLAILWQFRGAA